MVGQSELKKVYGIFWSGLPLLRDRIRQDRHQNIENISNYGKRSLKFSSWLPVCSRCHGTKLVTFSVCTVYKNIKVRLNLHGIKPWLGSVFGVAITTGFASAR